MVLDLIAQLDRNSKSAARLKRCCSTCWNAKLCRGSERLAEDQWALLAAVADATGEEAEEPKGSDDKDAAPGAP